MKYKLHCKKLARPIHGCGSLCIVGWQMLHGHACIKTKFTMKPPLKQCLVFTWVSTYHFVWGCKEIHKLSPYGYDLSWAAWYLPVVCIMCEINVQPIFIVLQIQTATFMVDIACMFFTKQGVGLCYYSEQMHTNFIGCKGLLTACGYGKL